MTGFINTKGCKSTDQIFIQINSLSEAQGSVAVPVAADRWQQSDTETKY